MQERLDSIRKSAYFRPAMLCGFVAAAALDWGLFGGILTSLSATAIYKLLDPEQPDPSPELVNAEWENEDVKTKLHEALVAGGLDGQVTEAIGNLEPGLAEEAWKEYTGFLEGQKRFLLKMADRLEEMHQGVRSLITAQQQGAYTLALTPGHLHEYLRDWIPANLVPRPELGPMVEALEQGRVHKVVLLGRALSGKSILAGQLAMRWLSRPGRAVALLATRPQTEQFHALAGLDPNRHLVICDPDYTGAEPLTPEEIARFRNLPCPVIVCQRWGQPKFQDQEKTLLDHLGSGPGGDYQKWRPGLEEAPHNVRVMVTLGGVDRELAGRIISANARAVFSDGGLTITTEARETLVNSLEALEGEDTVSIPGLARIVMLFIRNSLGSRPVEIDQVGARKILMDLGLNRRGLGEADHEDLLQRLFTRIINRDQEMILQIMARWQWFSKTAKVPRLALEAGYETKFKKNLNHEALSHLRDLEAAGVLTLGDSDDSYRVWHPKQLDVLTDDEPYHTRYEWLKESLVELDGLITNWLTDVERGPAVALGVAGLCARLGQANYIVRELTKVLRQVYELHRNLAMLEPVPYLPYVGVTANNLGAFFSGLGERHEARKLFEEALKIRRNLAKSEPGAYLPYVGVTANNLGTLLSKLGERGEARKLYEDALEIRRNLARLEPVAWLPDVAVTANNLGALLSELGERDEARKLYEEALEIRRNFAKSEPGVYLPDVATTANNLGALLSELGERGEARKLFEEALEIRRNRAKSEPGAYLPYVAVAANNLGNLLSGLGERDEARKLYEEALEIRRNLAKFEPGAYLPYVAGTANNLGTLLSKLGERGEARKLYEEALEIRRNLAISEPGIWLPDVAMTANNLGALLNTLGDRVTARKYYEEALEIYRNLSKLGPGAYLPDVATIANNLGTLLSDLGERVEARELYEEALEIRRNLAQCEPGAYRPEVAMTANNLGNLLSDLGECAEARKLFEEALEIYRSLTKSEPGAYLPDVAMTANNLGTLLDELGDRLAARELYVEALDIRRDLAEAEPRVYLPYVARTANNLGILVSGLGDRVAARELHVEALNIRSNLVKSEPMVWLPDYAESCHNYGAFLRQESEWADAATFIIGAVTYHALLFPNAPPVYGPRLRGSLAIARRLYDEPAFRADRDAWLDELKVQLTEAVSEEIATDLIGIILKVEDEKQLFIRRMNFLLLSPVILVGLRMFSVKMQFASRNTGYLCHNWLHGNR